MARLSKRAVLKGAGALGLSAFAIRVSPARRRKRLHPRGRGREERGQGRLLQPRWIFSLPSTRQGVRAALSRHQCAGGALRLERSSPGSDKSTAATSALGTSSTPPTLRTVWCGRSGDGLSLIFLRTSLELRQVLLRGDGAYITTRVLVSPFGYNTNLVKPEDNARKASPTCSTRNGRARW